MTLLRIDEHALGATWVVDEPMQRASHALADDGRTWLVDPVDEPEALEHVATLGRPVAVLQLLDRHGRDGAAIARRLGVPLVRLPRTLPDSPLEPIGLIRRPRWHEVMLWWPARRALVVPEAVGTAPLWAAGAPAGVHLMLRLTPPSRLRDHAPEHLLVGHGPPVHGTAAAALDTALDRSRRDLPAALLRVPSLLRR